MNASNRVAALRNRFEDDGPSAVIITDPMNIAYLTGFERVFDTEDAHAAIVLPDALRLYTDDRYAAALRDAAEGTSWEVISVRDNLYVNLCRDLTEMGVESIALESSMPHGRFRFISREFGGNVQSVDQFVEDIRQVKDDEEIRRIEASQQLTDAAFDHILGFVRVGATEWDVALELEYFMRRNGSDGVAFPPIVASGPNSALPHAKVTHRAIGTGEFVKMDFGARVDGYCADMTRTVVVGTASERHREIYDAVLRANLAGIASVRAGRAGSAIDAAAREVITKAGFGELFGHGLGHGLGMEVHEAPTVGPRGKKSVLQNSVITIEPGVYEPGFGGVRIEDLVVVESERGRVLTRSPKDLMEV